MWSRTIIKKAVYTKHYQNKQNAHQTKYLRICRETGNRKTCKPFNFSYTNVVILGNGFADIEVLKKLQKGFDSNKSIEITLISKDNFILFTPMLPEVASGMVETRP